METAIMWDIFYAAALPISLKRMTATSTPMWIAGSSWIKGDFFDILKEGNYIGEGEEGFFFLNSGRTWVFWNKPQKILFPKIFSQIPPPFLFHPFFSKNRSNSSQIRRIRSIFSSQDLYLGQLPLKLSQIADRLPRIASPPAATTIGVVTTVWLFADLGQFTPAISRRWRHQNQLLHGRWSHRLIQTLANLHYHLQSRRSISNIFIGLATTRWSSTA